VKIYQIAEGPLHACDVEGYENSATGYVVFALVEAGDGSLVEEGIHFDTWNLAMSLVNHFKEQIIPYEIILSDIYE
jgi:hypothetical protein